MTTTVDVAVGQPADAAGAPAPRLVELTRRLARSDKLNQRRLELLPLRGEGAAYTDVQGRGPGPTTSPEGLADLISSIAAVGVLQAVLVEEVTNDGRPSRLLVAGERRYRAARWGALNLPDNPHFAAIPAIVCPGPLTEEERRIWQLVENLAREPLQPGELAAALLLERCAIVTANLTHADRQVPEDVRRLEDPVARFKALEALRGADPDLAAPWTLVLQRLGLQISPRKARQLCAAFRALPRELSEDMDEHRITLAARVNLARLTRGRRQLANEMWDAVRQLGRTDLLSAATRLRAADPGLTADQAAAAAQDVHDQANAARSAALTAASPVDDTDPPSCGPAIEPDREAGRRGDDPPASSTGAPICDAGSPTSRADPDPAEECAGGLVEPRLVAETLTALRTLIAELSLGRRVGRYDAGSLRLLAGELTTTLDRGRHGAQEDRT